MGGQGVGHVARCRMIQFDGVDAPDGIDVPKWMC
jgi:hypothetical protein